MNVYTTGKSRSANKDNKVANENEATLNKNSKWTEEDVVIPGPYLPEKPALKTTKQEKAED